MKQLLQIFEKANFAHFVSHLKTSFGKSRSFNKQEADKMNKISSNQILEPIFSNQVLENDVDFIEKFIHCFLQGGPFGGPACPPVIIIIIIIIIIIKFWMY